MNELAARASLMFWVEGDPAPQGSKNRAPSGHLYEASKRLKPWRDTVAIVAMSQGNRRRFQDRQVEVRLTFYLRRDADVDKLCRAVLDGLTEGGVYDDDRYVVRLRAEKYKGKFTDLYPDVKAKALLARGHGCFIRVDPA